MPLQDYPSWELKPRGLSHAESENPLLVIHDFFSTCHLPETRQQLWELLKTTVTGTYSRTLNHRERSDILLFYEQLERLIEAAHLLYQQERGA